ncbi:DUF5615 family PIN-like protein [Thiohalocapsa marina]|uniref:DUF5615 family PIN-like protein n=1 Tax=Thiohalocapsa marina TaxID=424902 RepID=UPI0036D9B6FD
MRLLVDAQLPPALARWLSAQDDPADHVVDLGMDAVADRLIWQGAEQEGAVMVTKDEDFALWRMSHPCQTPSLPDTSGGLASNRSHAPV